MKGNRRCRTTTQGEHNGKVGVKFVGYSADVIARKYGRSGAADTVPYFFSAARCVFISSSRDMAASTFSGGKLSMSRFRLIANPISVGRCKQRRCRARLDHTLTQRQKKLVNLFVV